MQLTLSDICLFCFPIIFTLLHKIRYTRLLTDTHHKYLAESYVENVNRPKILLLCGTCILGLDQLANLHFRCTSVPRYTHMTD